MNELHEWLMDLDLDTLPDSLDVELGLGQDGRECIAHIPNASACLLAHRMELMRGVSVRLKSGTFDINLARIRQAIEDDDPFAF